MLSDESSSESETGRFKSHSKKTDDSKCSRNEKSLDRRRSHHNDSNSRSYDRRNNNSSSRRPELDHRDKHRNDRRSPIRFKRSPARIERRSSRERSTERHRRARTPTRDRREKTPTRDRRERTPTRDRRERTPIRDRSEKKEYTSKADGSSSNRIEREKVASSKTLDSKTHGSQEHSKDKKEGKTAKKHSVESDRKKVISDNVRKSITSHIAKNSKAKSEKSLDSNKQVRSDSSDRSKQKRSHVSSKIETKAETATSHKHKRKSVTKSPKELVDCHSPISEKSDFFHTEQPTSYYNTTVTEEAKHIPQETVSLSDSSEDEETLRARLLQLETELKKTKLKKTKKKHKRRHKQANKHKEEDDDSVVEVSSTTDIKDNKIPEPIKETALIEEGEISEDESDLREIILKSRNVNRSHLQDIAGPALPPHLAKKYEKNIAGDETIVEGPALPPHMSKKDQAIGPNIPLELRQVLAEKVDTFHLSSEDEDHGIGPLPEGADGKWTSAHIHLEERALEMKIKKLEGRPLNERDIKKREEWMLELPEAKAKIIGLGPRQFRAKEAPDMTDRSSWTDTPESRARRAKGATSPIENISVTLKREARSKQIDERDREQETAVKKHKKKHKRDESLLELHQKKLKKKKKKEDKDGPKERRPFDRNVDLQVNKFDEAQKKAIIKKAQHLDSRFSRGEAKYL